MMRGIFRLYNRYWISRTCSWQAGRLVSYSSSVRVTAGTDLRLTLVFPVRMIPWVPFFFFAPFPASLSSSVRITAEKTFRMV